MLGSGGAWTGSTAFATNTFSIIQPDSGTSPTADSSTDTLTLTSANANITISGNSSTDTITFTFVLPDGSLSTPGLNFSSDTNTGVYRVGTDQAALVAGGYAGLEFRKSTGAFANVGMGGAASVSDQYLLLAQRDYSGPIHFQLSNANNDAGSGSKIQVLAGAGNNYFEVGVFSGGTAAPDAYAGGYGTLRTSGSTAGINLIADDVSTAKIGFYCGGNGASSKMVQMDAVDGVSVYRTITAGGTTGNQTINKIAGTVNIAAAGTSVTVTNSLVDASSIVLAVLRTNDTTATIKNVVPSAGSFVITLGAAATAEVSIGWMVLN